MHLRKILPFVLALLILLPAAPALTDTCKVFGQSTSFAETFRRSGDGKSKFTRTFSVSSTSIPYTLTLTHGNRDGSQRAKKATLLLNGEEVTTLRKANGSLVAAVRLKQDNDLSLTMKGGSAEAFVSLSIAPTQTILLNSPADADFNSQQEGINYPSGLAIDSTSHHAYVADSATDSIIDFDLNQTRISRRYNNVDNDAIPGSSGTSSVCVNASARTMVTVSPADGSQGGTVHSGSIVVINLDSGSSRLTPLNNANPLFVADSPNTSVAAFTSLFSPSSHKAFFFDIASNAITTKDETASLISVASNPLTNEFVFSALADNQRPSLIIYSAASPFRRQKEIPSSATANTIFDRLAINPANNLAVAINLRDGAAFIFDLAAGAEVTRIPLRFTDTVFARGDVAINPETNMAVVVNRSLNLLYVIDLATGVLRGEYPLPNGINPLSVAIDTKLNVAVIGENGFSSTQHNGSVILVKLPERE